MKKDYRVVAGVMIQGEHILCGKRGAGFFESKWEFPGGKIEPGETKTEAIRREIREEIGCEVTKCVFFMTTKVEYKEFTIFMDTFLLNCAEYTPTATVHQELKWEKVCELKKYDWCDSDRMVVDKLIGCGIEKLHELLEDDKFNILRI